MPVSNEIVITARRAGFYGYSEGDLYRFLADRPYVSQGYSSPMYYFGAGSPPSISAVTPGGRRYATKLALSSSQKAVLEAIIDYGAANGLPNHYIKIAVYQAFYESSLGEIRNNPTNSDVKGLFQWDSSTWAEDHSGKNRFSDSDQIAAMYEDIGKFEQRWSAKRATNEIPSEVTFSDYVEIKHHLGKNSTDWTATAVSDYNKKS